MSSGIYRTQKTENFTMVRNEFIYDPNLSAKAKGILLYLLSRPNDWVTRIEDIKAHMADGIDSIKSGLKELQKAGYMIRRKLRNSSGHFSGWETIVLELPLPKMENPLSDETSVNKGFDPNFEASTSEITESGKSDSGKSERGKSTATNTELTNTELTKTKERKTPLNRVEGTHASKKYAKREKAESIYAMIQELSRFEAFWKWYSEKLCKPYGARPGKKAEAAQAWVNLEQSNYKGMGLDAFRQGCLIESKAFHAAKGVGIPHACRFLSGGELGEPDWKISVLQQDGATTSADEFLEGVDSGADLESVQAAIGSELQRLDLPGVLPAVWSAKTGVVSVSELPLQFAKEYLHYLKGVSRAVAS